MRTHRSVVIRQPYVAPGIAQTISGNVPMELMLSILDRQAELEPLDEPSNPKIRHLGRSGKANGLPHQAVDPCAECEMFTLQLLRPPFADHMLVWS
jgi:hypothetical protein